MDVDTTRGMDINTPFPVKGTIEINEGVAKHRIPCEDIWLTEAPTDYLQAAEDRVRKKYDEGTEVRVIWNGTLGECTGYAVIGPVDKL